MLKMSPLQFKTKRNSLLKSSGFALLIATLVSGIFLAIGAVILQIAYVQLLLSSIGRDSQFAFYAADTGAECALYWDRKYPSGDDSGSAFSMWDEAGVNGINRDNIDNGTLLPIVCSGFNIPGGAGTDFRPGNFVGGFQDQTYFKFTITDSSGTTRGCAEVVVSKEDNTNSHLNPNLSAPVKTTIVSRGYNICDSTSNRRVERAIQVTFQ